MYNYFDEPEPEHSDNEIVDTLYNDFPKIFEQIIEYLDHKKQ